ncbi:unnamed protein product [Phytophthora fragariaefolia]|uniref:Unnamed protein product n=1 Tax=Phytophthora fragariaefolia TaxID=1490495 RepID=A0A9W6YIA0_9STRA|nr:unnamed protein product [Phytophthora fragariaefolia]
MEDSGSRLPTRQDFPHLTDAHWATLDKMVSLLGEAAFAGFPNLSAEQQKARVERFDKYESSLIAHVSAAAQEAARAVIRAEAQCGTGVRHELGFIRCASNHNEARQDVGTDIRRKRLG